VPFEKLFTCERCEEPRPMSMFGRDKRRHRVCKLCKADENKGEKKLGRWDYADALRKATKMHVNLSSGSEGRYLDSLTSSKIRAIMQLQSYSCALTQQRLFLPSEDDLTKEAPDKKGKNVTFTRWLEKVADKSCRDRVPMIVRINREGDWEACNVMIVTALVGRFYSDCGGYANLKELGIRMINNTPRVYSMADLAEVEQIMNMERNKKEKWNKDK